MVVPNAHVEAAEKPNVAYIMADDQSGLCQQTTGKIRNVLLIMSDDLKASVLPVYGDMVCQTPNLDRLAASGMVFERAYCQGLAAHRHDLR